MNPIYNYVKSEFQEMFYMGGGRLGVSKEITKHNKFN